MSRITARRFRRQCDQGPPTGCRCYLPSPTVGSAVQRPFTFQSGLIPAAALAGRYQLPYTASLLRIRKCNHLVQDQPAGWPGAATHTSSTDSPSSTPSNPAPYTGGPVDTAPAKEKSSPGEEPRDHCLSPAFKQPCLPHYLKIFFRDREGASGGQGRTPG